VCVQAQTGALAAVWTYSAGYNVKYEGITDENGNVYFTEDALTGAPRNSVVSYTAQGQLRYRVIVQTPGAAPTKQMLQGRTFLFVTDNNHIVASNADTGALLWETSVTGTIEEWAALPNGQGLWVATSVQSQPAGDPGQLILLNLVTGVVRSNNAWRHRGLVVDADSHLWTAFENRIITFDANGMGFANIPESPLANMIGIPISISNHRLVTRNDTVYDTMTGVKISGPGFNPLEDTLQNANSRFRSESGDFAIFPFLTMTSYVATLGSRVGAMWSAASSASSHSGLTLLSNQETLWVENTNRNSLVHRWSGNEQSVCQLLNTWSGKMASFSGRYLTLLDQGECCDNCNCPYIPRISTFDLGVMPIGTGWISNEGTLGHARHETQVPLTIIH
jgi:hypothetical protein